MGDFDENLLIGEEDFSDALETRILPWVHEHLEEGYFHSGDGTKIHYHMALHPKEEAAIVISHGFCEFVCKYHEVMYYFYEMGYSVFFLEYRGHGFSQRFVEELDRVYVKNYEEYVEDLHSFMEQIVKKKSQSQRRVLFAHSMGGCIGALYLEEYPKDFERAILSAPLLQMNFRDVPEWAVGLLVLWSKIAHWDLRYVPGQKGFDGIPAFETSSCLSKSRYDYVFSWREREPHYTSYGGTYAWTNASLRAIKKVHKNASKVEVPILLFQAGRDGMVKPEGQDDFAMHTKATKLVRYEDSKHEIFNATKEIRLPYYQEIFAFMKSL